MRLEIIGKEVSALGGMILPLICPHDRQPLSEMRGGAICSQCGRHYPVRDGVLCMLERPDGFYEGAYGNKTLFVPRSEKFWHAWPLWLINGGYLWNVRRFVPAGATVVELGCAGGVCYFGQRYRMVGCDLSFASLRKIEFYAGRIQADAAAGIPLPDNSADAVVSSYFWEHIPPTMKPHILQECRRVLKPGGKIIFLYDVETKNPLISYYKRKNISLYEKLFLEGDAHLGYQRPAENLQMFTGAGFRVKLHIGMEKTFLQSPSAYIKLAQFETILKRLFAFAERFGRQPLIYPYTALMRVIDAVVCPWLPEEWARIYMTICEKQ